MNVDPATIQETLDMQPLKLSESELNNINEKSGCAGKGEDVPENMTSVNFTFKELSLIFHDIESTKGKMSEGDLNLKRSMTICHGLEYIASIS